MIVCDKCGSRKKVRHIKVSEAHSETAQYVAFIFAGDYCQKCLPSRPLLQDILDHPELVEGGSTI